MARRPAPTPITSVRIETPAPAVPTEGEGDVRRPWPWQKEAIDKLKASARRMLTAPTGSGKSLVVESLGLHDLDLGMKVIVAVPQLSIGRGYERESIDVDGERREWDPAVRVHAAEVRAIVRFLLEPPAASESARTLVCTQLALVMAARHPDVVAVADPWEDVSLFLDEAHHALALGETVGRDGRRSLHNALGSIVNHYLRACSGPLTLITATWMRTDDGAIVPAPALETFARYHRGFDQHMKDMRHIRTLEIRFVVGVATECLEALFKERHPSTTKTVVWHPAPGSDLLSQQGGKHGALAKYRRATGWRPRRTGRWDTHEFDGKVFSALELIDDGHQRNVSMNGLLAGIDAQKQAARNRRDVEPAMNMTPDVVWALNLLREGSDYPALARGILMAPRGAMLDTLQMLGRLLRDFPGKQRVEFNIILPIDGPAATPTAGQVSGYLRYMMASLLVEWQFGGFGLDGPSPTGEERHELSFLERSDVQQQFASDIVDAAIRIADAGHTPEEEAERIAHEVIERGTRLHGFFPRSKEVVKRRLRQMLLGRGGGSATGLGAFEVEDTIVGRLRLFVGKFGYEDLRALREGLGRPAHLTIDQVHASMWKFHAQHGRWPTLKTVGSVPDIGGTWLSIQEALVTGGRGLSGGSSLAKEKHTLVGTTPREPLTKERLIDGIIAYKRKHGSWPTTFTKGRLPGLSFSWRSFCTAVIRKMIRDGLLPTSYFPSTLVREAKDRLTREGTLAT